MSYFAQIRIVDEEGNSALVTEGQMWIKLEGTEEILTELRIMNRHLATINGEEIKEEDL